MKSLGRHLCVLFTLVAAAYAENWDYRENGPLVWGEHFPSCNGNHQSPILLNKKDTVELSMGLARRKLVSISFQDYDTVAPSVFSNNGHSVNVAFNYSKPSTHPRVVVSSATDTATYYLQGLHFHWISEHSVENKKYPLEMHMVHQDDNGDKLVMGYVFQECERRPWPWAWAWAGTGRSSQGLAQLAQVVPRLTVAGSQESMSFAPSRLLPIDMRPCGYFVYQGSLTTPPCSEGVTWFVHREPLCAEDWQLETFHNILDAENRVLTDNSRPLQERNGRSVLFLTC